MWQRFTEAARKVVFYAQEEAQRFGEGYVSTEHLLLGLLREPDCTGCEAIIAQNIQPDRIRMEVEKQLPSSDRGPFTDMTLTPRAKRVVDLAYDSARNLNNDFIGTEHLLLGLIREGDGLAGKVLAKVNLRLDRTTEVVQELQKQSGIGAGAQTAQQPKKWPFSFFKQLSGHGPAPETGVEASAWSFTVGYGRGRIDTGISLLVVALEPGAEVEAKLLPALGVPTERLVRSLQFVWAMQADSGPNPKRSLEAHLILANELAKDPELLSPGTVGAAELLLAVLHLAHPGLALGLSVYGLDYATARAKIIELRSAPPPAGG